jgi:hypothetical protein
LEVSIVVQENSYLLYNSSKSSLLSDFSHIFLFYNQISKFSMS